MRDRPSAGVSGCELAAPPAKPAPADARGTAGPGPGKLRPGDEPGRDDRATHKVLSSRKRRQRGAVSLSSPEPTGEPVEQLDRAVEIIDQVTRALPDTFADREELVALAGVLTQLGRALHTLSDRLIDPVHHDDRTRSSCPGGVTTPYPCHATE
jgi:hypothetical protein